ncbi:MAG: hypothetical protein ACTHPO_08485 [Alphaproteobacteria bacterium]
MRNLSLAAAMEAFVKRPELLELNDAKADKPEKKPLDKLAGQDIPASLDRVSQEMTLFMSVDPVLASLHKEYLDACAILDDLAEKGDNAYAAMAAVASDRVQSAHSAFSARLIELRNDEKISAMIQMKRHRLLLEEMEERRLRRRMLEEKAFMYQKDTQEKQKQEHNRRRTFAMDLFIAYMMMSWSTYNQNKKELKYAFEDAFIGNRRTQKTGTAS